MTLLDTRRSYRPFEYEKAYNYFEEACLSHWLWTKVSMSADILDWQTQMTDSEKKIVAGVLNGFTQSELVIGDYWSNKVTRWFPKPEIASMAVTFSSFECFDEKSELLTSTGWKFCKDLALEDLVAQYDLETKEISFVNPDKVWSYSYNGIMHEYKGRTANILVTPNHDLITIHPSTKRVTKRKSYESKLGQNYLYPTSGIGIGKDSSLTAYERVLIAVQADGCVRGLCPSYKDSINRTVDFGLTKTRKINRLKTLLEEAGISYTFREKNKKSIISFTLPEYQDLNSIKNLGFLDLENISSEKACSIIEEILMWDASRNTYYNTNKEAVDKVQAIAALSNKYTASIGINRTALQSLKLILPQGNRPKTTKDCYAVSITEVVKKGYPYKKEVEYNGQVYCVSVEKQNIISRREGKVAFTGNCIHARSYNNLTETLGLEDYDAFEQDTIVRKRLENLINTPDESLEDIARSLAVFSAFCEGVCLFSSFAVLKYFPLNNKLKGVGTIIDWSQKDEGSHSEAGCWLFRQLMSEMPQIDPNFDYEQLRKKVYEGAHTVIELESKFIDEIFNGNTLDGLDPEDLKQYIRYRINLKLSELGYEGNIDVDLKAADRIKSWFDVSTGSQKQQDFFAQMPTDYARNALAIDDAKLDFALDF